MQPSLFAAQAKLARVPASAAALRDRGVSRSSTSGQRWRRSSYGHYVPADQHLSTAQRIVDLLPCLRDGGAFAGWAAAFVQGVDWMDGLDSLTGQALAVPLCLGPDVHRRSTPTVRYVRDRLTDAEVVRRHGLPVTDPFRTAFDTGRWASSLTEAVVALDALAHFGLVSLPTLSSYVAGHPGWPGVSQVRRALSLADAAVRSPWESRLRMVYVLEAGLGRPMVNRSVFSHTGRLLGIADLIDEEAGLVLEYDGSGHREWRQHNSDNEREEAFEGAGLVVVRADSHDYRHKRARLIERMVGGRRRGMARDRRGDRWTLTPPSWATDPYELLTDDDKQALFGAA